MSAMLTQTAIDMSFAAKAKDLLRQYTNTPKGAYGELVAECARWALRGYRILSSRRAIQAAGFDSFGRPKIAIARADWKRVRVENNRFTDPRMPWHVRLRDARSVPHPPAPVTRQQEGVAVVPSIPPDIREQTWCGNQLHNYWIAFDAKWEPTAPGDPLLLKRLHTEVFVVLAHWDLSPIEQLALEATITSAQ